MEYADISTCAGQAFVGYSMFRDLWNQLGPFIMIMRPVTDLCWTCQKNNNCIEKSVNLPEVEKAEAVKAQEHLLRAVGERTFYQRLCHESKENLQHYIKDVNFSVRPYPRSYDKTMHYSYDYAQQLHYPADPN